MNHMYAFNDEQLQRALKSWADAQGDLVGRHDLDMIVSGFDLFLQSPQAAKLRVNLPQPAETPTHTTLLPPPRIDPNQRSLVLG